MTGNDVEYFSKLIKKMPVNSAKPKVRQSSQVNNSKMKTLNELGHANQSKKLSKYNDESKIKRLDSLTRNHTEQKERKNLTQKKFSAFQLLTCLSNGR